MMYRWNAFGKSAIVVIATVLQVQAFVPAYTVQHSFSLGKPVLLRLHQPHPYTFSFELNERSNGENDKHHHNNHVTQKCRNGERNSITIEQSRRTLFSKTAAVTLSLITTERITNTVTNAEENETITTSVSSTENDKVKKVLVLGATGFVGSQVTKKLKSLGIEVIGTSRDGREGTMKLDFSDSSTSISKVVEQLSSGCQAVISCIGAIGTAQDGVVNTGTGLAAIGAKAAGVKSFVYVSVAPEVRDVSQNIDFLKDYMTGKLSSERSIQENFGGSGSSFMLIEPTFIYGGDSFNVNPPRVAEGYGKLVEALLSSGVFRAAAKISPGIIGIALEPPVSVYDVADAAVVGALGYSVSVLDTYDKILDASASLK